MITRLSLSMTEVQTEHKKPLNSYRKSMGHRKSFLSPENKNWDLAQPTFMEFNTPLVILLLSWTRI